MSQSTKTVRLTYFVVDAAAAAEEPWPEEATEDAEPPEDGVDAAAEGDIVISSVCVLSVVEMG
jgi:hypothetical protein